MIGFAIFAITIAAVFAHLNPQHALQNKHLADYLRSVRGVDARDPTIIEGKAQQVIRNPAKDSITDENAGGAG